MRMIFKTHIHFRIRALFLLVIAVFVTSASGCVKRGVKDNISNENNLEFSVGPRATQNGGVCLIGSSEEVGNVSKIFINNKWKIAISNNKSCEYIVHYNENYKELSYIDPYKIRVSNTEKCIFDYYIGNDGSIILLRAAAIRSQSNSYLNCSMRALLALNGRINALKVRDEKIDLGSSQSVEAVLVRLAKNSDIR